MRHYESKTKEELLEIIEQLEEKIDFLSSHLFASFPRDVFAINTAPGYWMPSPICSPSSTMMPIL